MHPDRVRRIAVIPLVLAAGVALGGCAGDAGPYPTATATLPTPSATAVSPEPSPTAVAPESADDFTEAQLAQLCEGATSSAFGVEVTFDLDDARIERRTVTPEWLVLVPVQSSTFTNAQAQCTIGGTPSAPVIEMSSASLHPFPEEQVQNLIRGENEGGTE